MYESVISLCEEIQYFFFVLVFGTERLTFAVHRHWNNKLVIRDPHLHFCCNSWLRAENCNSNAAIKDVESACFGLQVTAQQSCDLLPLPQFPPRNQKGSLMTSRSLSPWSFIQRLPTVSRHSLSVGFSVVHTEMQTDTTQKQWAVGSYCLYNWWTEQ